MRLAGPLPATLLGLTALAAAAACSSGPSENQAAEEAVSTSREAISLADVASGDLSNIGQGDFSISFQIRTGLINGVYGLLGQRSICGHALFWDIRLDNGAVLVETDDNTPTGYAAVTSSRGVADGANHTVVVQRVNQTLSITVDGVASGSTTSTTSFGNLAVATSEGAYGCVGQSGTQLYTGTLFGVSVDAAPLYAPDLSNIGGSDFAFGLALQTTASTGTFGLVGQRNVCGHGNFWDLHLQNGTLVLETDDGTATGYTPVQGTVNVADGKVHVVQITRARTTLRITVDGLTDNGGTSTSLFGQLPPVSTGIYGCVDVPGGTETNYPGTLSNLAAAPRFGHDLSNLGQGDFDIDFQVSTAQQTGSVGLLGQRGACLGGNLWDIRMVNGQVQAELRDNGVHDAVVVSSADIADGALHNVDIRRSSSVVTITVDGAVTASQTAAASFGPLPAVATGVYGCVNQDGTAALTGSIGFQLAGVPVKTGGRIGDVITSATIQNVTETFSGATTTPNALVSVYGYNNTGDPALLSSYALDTQNFNSTKAFMFQGTAGLPTSPMYAYSTPPTILPAAAQGGLARFKIELNGADLPMFDDNSQSTIDQFLSVADGIPWSAVLAGAASPVGNVATLVSSTPTPEAAHGLSNMSFLGVGGHQFTTPVAPSSKQGLTENYYTAIKAPTTFAAFTSKFGFGPSADSAALYYNNGDLGLGRDMHCVQNTATGIAACYVSNYGTGSNGKAAFGQNPDTSINQAIAKQGLIATVAMVYDPSNATNTIQFIVYDASGNRSDFAALDNPGLTAIANPTALTTANITVPENCLTCHGGTSTYNAGSNVTGAHFLPFDPNNFRYSTQNAAYSETAQLPNFRALNAIVIATQPSAVISDFITGTYAPKVVTDVTATTNLAYVPSGWTSGGKIATDVYNEVVKPYCRMCHLSQDSAAFNWLTWSNFQAAAGLIGPQVCSGSTIPMPQAERTQNLLWQSPGRAHLVNALDISGKCGPTQ